MTQTEIEQVEKHSIGALLLNAGLTIVRLEKQVEKLASAQQEAEKEMIEFAQWVQNFLSETDDVYTIKGLINAFKNRKNASTTPND